MLLLVLPGIAATLRVGVDAATLPATLELAASGDTVEIPAGRWEACVNPEGRSLDLVGEPGAVVVGAGCESVFTVEAGETLRVLDLELQNPGGRIFDMVNSNLDLEGVTIQGTGSQEISGGVLRMQGGELRTGQCSFRENLGGEGGAIYLVAYVDWQDTGSLFAGNQATVSGGAVMARYANRLNLQETIFADNRAGNYGGGIAAWDYSAITATGTRFSENRAVDGGGGAIFLDAVDMRTGALDVADSEFDGNSAGDGGAIWAGWLADARVYRSRFSQNTAERGGGALYGYTLGSITTDHNLFCGNRAASGGGIALFAANLDTIAYNVFLENQATKGGAAHRSASASGVLLHNTFVGNAALQSGGAYFEEGAYTVFTDNIVADTPSGAGAYASDPEDASAVAFNGWAANIPSHTDGYFVAENGVNGNIYTEDPAFVAWSRDGDCTNDDLRLSGDSPFKNAGDPNLPDPDGSRADLGAYGGPEQPVEDADADGFTTLLDCDDTSSDHYPEAPEFCNAVDDDCDGRVDEEGAADGQVYYPDEDGDGFGRANDAERLCERSTGWATNPEDCDDTNPWINPAAKDLPGNDLDENCDGEDTEIHAIDSGAQSGCGCGEGRGFALLFALTGLVRRKKHGSTMAEKELPQRPPDRVYYGSCGS